MTQQDYLAAASRIAAALCANSELPFGMRSEEAIGVIGLRACDITDALVERIEKKFATRERAAEASGAEVMPNLLSVPAKK